MTVETCRFFFSAVFLSDKVTRDKKKKKNEKKRKETHHFTLRVLHGLYIHAQLDYRLKSVCKLTSIRAGSCVLALGHLVFWDGALLQPTIQTIKRCRDPRDNDQSR